MGLGLPYLKSRGERGGKENIHEGLARESVNPRTRHDGGYATFSPGNTAWGDIGDLDGVLVEETDVRPGAPIAMLVYGTLKLDAFAVLLFVIVIVVRMAAFRGV